jgi:TolB protein
MSYFSRFVFILCTGFLLGVSLLGCSGAGSNSNGNGEGEPTEDTSAPSAPSGLSADSKEGAVGLDWEAVGADDLDEYNVYRDTSPISDISGRSPVADSPGGESTYNDESVSNGSTYHYRVTAIDENGNESDPSAEATATPFSEPPDRP